LGEIRLADPPSRSELRRRVRHGLSTLEPGLRVLAEQVCGMTTSIDLVALDPRGNVLVVLIGSDGEQAELLTRALAHRAWLAPRLRDWVQLAPQLEISANASVRAVLLAPDFDCEMRLAVASLPAGTVELATWRYVENEHQRAVLIERVDPYGEAPDAPAEISAAPSAPAFRSGLSEADLDLSADELRELE